MTVVSRVRVFQRRTVGEEATKIANTVGQSSNETNRSVTCATLLCSCRTGDYENGPCQMQQRLRNISSHGPKAFQA